MKKLIVEKILLILTNNNVNKKVAVGKANQDLQPIHGATKRKKIYFKCF